VLVQTKKNVDVLVAEIVEDEFFQLDEGQSWTNVAPHFGVGERHFWHHQHVRRLSQRRHVFPKIKWEKVSII
jgi:hypothetical protein